jgi:hypothetical protein
MGLLLGQCSKARTVTRKRTLALQNALQRRQKPLRSFPVVRERSPRPARQIDLPHFICAASFLYASRICVFSGDLHSVSEKAPRG